MQNRSANSFADGSRYLFRGFALLKRPRILPFVVIPIVLNVLLFALGINYLYDTFAGWLDSLLAAIPEWLGFIKWLLWPLFTIFVLLVVAYGFTFVANLIGSPFYGLMAEQAEMILTGKTADIPLTLKSVLAMIPASMMREIHKLAIYLAWVIPLLLLSALSLLITPLAPFMPVAWFLFGAWMLSIQYIDYCYDNHQIGVKKLREDIRGQRNTALGFGGVTTVASMIPLLNIIVVPAAVCGGTVFWVEKLASKQSAGSESSLQ